MTAYGKDWSDVDPRDHEGKMGMRHIVILTPNSICTGSVETEHGYDIMYSARIILPVNETRPVGMIGRGEEWPKGWKWILAPQ